MSISEEIQRLHELRQAGALTDAEFETAKAKLLATQVSLDKGGSAGDDFGTRMNNLRRTRLDRQLAGVCSGLAKTTGVDAWIWRLAFVLLTIAGFAGVLMYVLMWIFVPEE